MALNVSACAPMGKISCRPGSLAAVVLLLVALLPERTMATEPKPAYSPAVANPIPRQVYWGDLHQHTNNSVDAYSLGTTTFAAADAYRFAQGQAVTVENGVKAKLKRPLDFFTVTDHGEFLGVLPRIRAGDPELLSTEVGFRCVRPAEPAPEALGGGTP